jgi:hypothetical protein
VTVAGCTELVVEPKSTVTAANIFNDAGSYRSFMAKIYAGLGTTGQQGPAGRPDISGIDEGFSEYLRLYWQMQELPTDEAAIAWNDDGVQQLNTQIWSSSNQFLVAMYYRVFFQVTLVNEFLRETTDDKLTSRGVAGQLRTDIQQYRAEARFLRALSYWHGLDLFGSIPLVTENDPLGSAPPQQRTRSELFDYVVSELTEAMAGLPPAGAAEYGRADQGAAQMLLAKLYLNSEVYTGTPRYAEALTAAEAVINGGYALDDVYRHMFLADNHLSPEIVFAIPQDGLHTRSFGGMTFLTHASVGGSMNTTDFGIDFGWWGLRLRPEAVALYTDAADSRASLLYTSGQTQTMNNLTDFTNGYAFEKYANVTSTGAPGSNAAHPDTDYPMFRLADAYLIYAEASLRGGGGSASQALAYVNALRQRAFGDNSGDISASELTLDFLLDERARELMWEGHRRQDLIRYDQFTANGVWAWKGGTLAGAPTETFRALYPLPASELLANPNLTQNPGYGN